MILHSAHTVHEYIIENDYITDDSTNGYERETYRITDPEESNGHNVWNISDIWA